MGGRPAKPVQLHLLNGNKRHLTKEEIAARQRQEAKTRSGIKIYKPSSQVENDPAALAMFKKLKKLYKSIEFVEGLDENIINRYCLLHSEYVQIRDVRQGLSAKYEELDAIEEKLRLSEHLSELDKRLDKKMDLLLKLEDRLFLNPTARVKNVPKKEPPKVDPLANKGFGNV